MHEVKPAQDFQRSRRDNLTRRWNLPSRNLNFTGRENLLDQISQRLSGSKPLVITACHGLGGVGKTQLVTEFAYRNENKYERIIWITSESTEQIETAYLSLGQDLGIIPEKTPSAEVIHRVKNWLSNHPRNLIIFDNAPDNKTVEGYELSSGADILITSRNKDWEGGLAVDVFSLEEAVLYFKKIVVLRAQDTKEKIEELAEELGRLPLALAQAAAYIRQNKISIQAYIDLYQEKKAYLLSLSVLPEGDQHVSVYVTWDITMERIKQESELAPALLNICSYLHSEKIPALLLEPFCEDEKYNPEKRETLEEARGCLRSYSMVTVEEEDNTVSVHRVVQDVTRLKLTEDEYARYLDTVFTLCVMCFPYGETRDNLDDIARKKILLPHLRAVLVCLTKKAEWEATLKNNYIKLVLYLADACEAIGEFSQQKMLLENLLPLIEEGVRESNEAMTEVVVRLSGAYAGLRQLNLQQDYIERSLKVVTDPFRRASLTMSLANVYGDFGQNDKCLRLLEDNVLPSFRALFDEQNIYVARAKGNISNMYGIAGNPSKQKEILDEIMPIYCSYYGVNHPLYANTLIAYGQACGKLFLRTEQRRYLEKALTIIKSFYGENHGLVAHVLVNLSLTYNELSEQQERKRLLERALFITKDFYGSEHFDVALSLIGLADVYDKLEDFQAQISHLKQAQALLKAQFNSDNVFIVMTSMYLGVTYGVLGEFLTAKQMLEEAYVYRNIDSMASNKVFLLLYLTAAEIGLNGHCHQSELYLKELSALENLDVRYHKTAEVLFGTYAQTSNTFVALKKLESAIRLNHHEEYEELMRAVSLATTYSGPRASH